MQLRVLTWSPRSGGSECGSPEELAVALDRFDCDVAALRDVPARWPALAARRSLAEYRQSPPRRRPIWRRLGSAGRGGATTAVIARRDRLIDDRLQQWSRRRLLGVRLACGLWVVVLDTAAGERPAARADGQQAARAALGWSEGGAVVLALPQPADPPPPGFVPAAAGAGAQLLLAGPVEPVRAATDPRGALILDLRLDTA
ncbi:MAG TPA: hypothetical protein VFN87_21420 [Solirubrobacteraceae bacterium]|nr:hypothetical protein [Solirubrobacteraceae bacterium]